MNFRDTWEIKLGDSISRSRIPAGDRRRACPSLYDNIARVRLDFGVKTVTPRTLTALVVSDPANRRRPAQG